MAAEPEGAECLSGEVGTRGPQWDFEISHRKGAFHHVPDALSRGFESGEKVAAFEEEVRKFPKKYVESQ